MLIFALPATANFVCGTFLASIGSRRRTAHNGRLWRFTRPISWNPANSGNAVRPCNYGSEIMRVGRSPNSAERIMPGRSRRYGRSAMEGVRDGVRSGVAETGALDAGFSDFLSRFRTQ